jgi:hypothetical protein
MTARELECAIAEHGEWCDFREIWPWELVSDCRNLECSCCPLVPDAWAELYLRLQRHRSPLTATITERIWLN